MSARTESELSKASYSSAKRLEEAPSSVKRYIFNGLSSLLNQDTHVHPMVYYLFDLI
jgi:hypothetical protein